MSKTIVVLEDVLEFIRKLKPIRYTDNPGYVDIDLTPKEVADAVEREFK